MASQSSSSSSSTSPLPQLSADDRALGDWNMLGVLGQYAVLYTDALDRLDLLHHPTPHNNKKDGEETVEEEGETAKAPPLISHIDRTARSMDVGVKIYVSERNRLLEMEGGQQTMNNLPELLALERNKPLGAFKLRELDARAYAEHLFLFHFFPAHLMLMTPPDRFQAGENGGPSPIVVTRHARVVELYQFSAWLHAEAPAYFKPLYQQFFPKNGENLPQFVENTKEVARVTIKIHGAMLETHNGTLRALAARCSEEQLIEVSNDLRDGINIPKLAQRFKIAEKTLWITRTILLFFEENAAEEGNNARGISQRKAERQAKQQSEKNRKIQARNERNAQRNARRRAKRAAAIPEDMATRTSRKENKKEEVKSPSKEKREDSPGVVITDDDDDDDE